MARKQKSCLPTLRWRKLPISAAMYLVMCTDRSKPIWLSNMVLHWIMLRISRNRVIRYGIPKPMRCSTIAL
ncbi:MAG: hypothetical protein J5621_07680 [Paludibacteraceae bacterium]|nr:hypothetical protein [Paludibacteraceae bacterium]